MPIRVAFVGPAGSGKTTNARLMQQSTGGDVLSFATPLKKMVADLLGPLEGEELRGALQEFGVLARKYDQLIWVKKLLAKVSPDRPCYIDDCRFYNEAVALRNLDFAIVRLDAPVYVLMERRPGMTEAQRLHASEIELANITPDFTVMTDPPIEAVFERVENLVYSHHPEWEKRKKAVRA